MASKKDDGKFSSREIGKETAVLEISAKKEQELIDKLTEQLVAALGERLNSYKEFAKAKERVGAESAAKELKLTEEQTKQWLNIEKDAKIRAFKIAEEYEVNQYKKLTAKQRYDYAKTREESLKESIQQKKKEVDAYSVAESDLQKKLEIVRASGNIKQEEDIKKELAAIEIRKQAKKEEAEEEQKLLELTKTLKDRYQKGLKGADKKAAKKEDSEKAVENANLKVLNAQDKKSALEEKHTKEQEKLQKKLDTAKKNGNKNAIKNIEREMKAKEKAFKSSQEYIEAEQELEEANAEKKKASLKEFGRSAGEELKRAGKQALGNLAGNMTRAVDESISAIYAEQGRMNARMQGLDHDFVSSIDKVTKNVGMSTIVSQKAIVAKMTEMIDSGVAYNMELRAFLAATAENIASTFNAFDANLLRLIKIQQADTTAARLGMEASLTKLFNSTFKDTSYLAADVYDSVSAAILDANSQMTRDQSLEFEYILQKWLGALYSVGMSDTAVTTIAEGINYLTTGNVSALNGNDALQTLLAMSASRTTKSYAEMLTNGLTAKDTNDLLKAMVEYLAEIATSQSNFVTKSAYANLFNMSITDLSTVANLEAKTINDLYAQTQNYTSLIQETGNQLNSISSRLNISQQIDTMIDNAMTSAASDIGQSTGLYATWKALNIVNDVTGGIKIPPITAMGFGIAGDLNILEVAKVGIAGFSLLGSLMGAAGNGSLFNSTDLTKWGYDEYNSKGNPLKGITGGFTSGTSQSESFGRTSASGEDVKETSLQDSYDEAGTTSEEQEEGADVPLKTYEAITRIETLLDPQRIFYSSIAGVVSNGSTSNVSLLTSEDSTTSSAVKTINTLQTSIAYNRALAIENSSSVTKDTAEVIAESSKGLIDVVNTNNENIQNMDLGSSIATSVAQALSGYFNKLENNSISSPIYVTPVAGGM